jgi:potassium channel subfamily K
MRSKAGRRPSGDFTVASKNSGGATVMRNIQHVETRRNDENKVSRFPNDLARFSNRKCSPWWLATISFPVLAVVLAFAPTLHQPTNRHPGNTMCNGNHVQRLHGIPRMAGSSRYRWENKHPVSASLVSGLVPIHFYLISQTTVRAITLKAVSLALAASAYIVLLLTMMSKRDPAKGFTVTIIGWFASAAILFSLIGVVARQRPIAQPQQALHYTQNFFYGILAAGLYILIAILLAIYTASAHTIRLSRNDRQTIECTSIILQTITFAVFLLGGAAMYSSIEGWSFMDGLYFTDYTLLTIGIGNIVPKTHLGRSLLFPYATVGIIALGLVVSSIASFARDILKVKLRFKLEQVRIDMHERGDSLGPINGPDNESTLVPASARFPSRSEVLKVHRIKSDFYRRRRWEAFLIFLAAWFVLWLVSAVIFHRSERSQDWSYFAALYFTYTSLTTIGYGDLYPTSNFGKVFFVFWSLLAIPVLTNLVTTMGEIGLQTLTYFSGYIWRLGVSRGRAQQHRHRSISQSQGEKGGNGLTKRPLDPESLSGGTNTERQAQGPSTTRQLTKDLERISTKTSSGCNKLEPSKSINEAIQRKLLLAEEIEKLVAALRGESRHDPWGDWMRTLSLLHAGEDEGPSSLEPPNDAVLHDCAQIVTRKLGSDKAVADRNGEILWMLKFLSEKLCSELRGELYRETE